MMHYFKWKPAALVAGLWHANPKAQGNLLSAQSFKCVVTMIKDVSNGAVRSVSRAPAAGQPENNNKYVLVLISNPGYLLSNEMCEQLKKRKSKHIEKQIQAGRE